MPSNRTRTILFTLAAAVFLVTADHAVAAEAGCPGRPERVASDAALICPSLVGTAAAAAQVRDIDGAPKSLQEVLSGKPTVLLFYRGGWCPFCNAQLGQIQTVEAEIRALGFQVIAISPDRPEKLQASREAGPLTYTLLSDSEMNAARAFGIAFRVDDTTVRSYKERFSIDLEGNSGQTHHQLPVPSVFVVGADGVIRFSYVNPDYKTRISPAVLLAAVKAARS